MENRTIASLSEQSREIREELIGLSPYTGIVGDKTFQKIVDALDDLVRQGSYTLEDGEPVEAVGGSHLHAMLYIPATTDVYRKFKLTYLSHTSQSLVDLNGADLGYTFISYR